MRICTWWYWCERNKLLFFLLRELRIQGYTDQDLPDSPIIHESGRLGCDRVDDDSLVTEDTLLINSLDSMRYMKRPVVEDERHPNIGMNVTIRLTDIDLVKDLQSTCISECIPMKATANHCRFSHFFLFFLKSARPASSSCTVFPCSSQNSNL